jgi:hypothetical protein
MSGCSLKEVFPEFSKSVNLNPKLQPGAQRYGVEPLENANAGKPLGEDTMFRDTKMFKLEDARGTSRPLIEHFENASTESYDSLPKPYSQNQEFSGSVKNIGKFEGIPANIEEMLETSVGDMDVDPFGGVEYPSGLDYSFDKIPYTRENRETREIRETRETRETPQRIHVSEKMIIHVKSCEGCRERLKGIVGNVIVRESMNPMEQMTEFLTFVGVGIFIIFVLDIMKRKN